MLEGRKTNNAIDDERGQKGQKVEQFLILTSRLLYLRYKKMTVK